VGRGREGPSDDPSMQQSIALEKTSLSKRVLFETIFTLQRYYWVPTPQIKDLLLPTLGLWGPRFPSKHLYYAALDLAPYMQAKGMTEVYVGTRILIAAKALHGLSQRSVRTHNPH
jgi:hypothetical protein